MTSNWLDMLSSDANHFEEMMFALQKDVLPFLHGSIDRDFISVDHRVRALELPGVYSIVGVGRHPIPLPYEEIEALRSGMHLLNA
jgi:hypothetical protein